MSGGRRGEFESESVAPFPRPRSKPALLLARRHLGPIFRFSLLDCLQVTEQDETGGQSGDGAAFEAITICVHDESERAAASLIRRGEGGADPDRNSARSAHQLNKSRSRRLASPARSVHPFIQSFSSSRLLRRPSGTFALGAT